MTTRVTVECEYTNCATGQMLAGTSQDGHFSASLMKPPFRVDFWVHDGKTVVCREASPQDVADRQV